MGIRNGVLLLWFACAYSKIAHIEIECETLDKERGGEIRKSKEVGKNHFLGG